MTRTIQALSDRMLNRLLGHAEAGACVPDVGLQCGPCQRTTDYFCIGHDHIAYFTKHKKVYNCSGSCVLSSSSCGSEYGTVATCP